MDLWSVCRKDGCRHSNGSTDVEAAIRVQLLIKEHCPRKADWLSSGAHSWGLSSGRLHNKKWFQTSEKAVNWIILLYRSQSSDTDKNINIKYWDKCATCTSVYNNDRRSDTNRLLNVCAGHYTDDRPLLYLTDGYDTCAFLSGVWNANTLYAG